jgi:hypothetical protein
VSELCNFLRFTSVRWGEEKEEPLSVRGIEYIALNQGATRDLHKNAVIQKHQLHTSIVIQVLHNAGRWVGNTAKQKIA